MNRSVVPKGTIRRIMDASRRYRDPGVSTIDPDTAAAARTEIAASIPVFTVDAGRRELASIMASARTNARVSG